MQEKQSGTGTVEWYERLRDYAEFFVKWGKWAEAEKHYRRLLAAYEGFPDKNYAFEEEAAERLADLCWVQSKKDDTEGFYRLALADWEKVLIYEKESDAFVEFLKSMAIFYRGIGKEQEAEKLEKRAEAIHTRLQQEKEKTLDRKGSQESRIRSRSVALRHPAIQFLPPCGMMSLKDLKEHHYTKCPRPLFYKNIIEGMSLSDRAGLRHIPFHPDQGGLGADDIELVDLVQGMMDIAAVGLVGHHDDGDRLLYLSPFLYDRGDADLMLSQDTRDGGEDTGSV